MKTGIEADAKEFVMGCFSAQEWDWLSSRTHFLASFNSVESLEDAEALIIEGVGLLSKSSRYDVDFHLCGMRQAMCDREPVA